MNKIFLMLTAAIVVGGEIALAGEIVEVTQNEARDLLNRGKARIATEADGAPAAPEGNADAPGGHQGTEQAAADTSAPAAPKKQPKTAKTQTAEKK